MHARLGAVRFMHCFGSSLNRHVHYRCCIIDGLFEFLDEGQMQFREALALSAKGIAEIGEQVRRRVLRWFARSGLLAADGAGEMLGSGSCSVQGLGVYRGVCSRIVVLQRNVWCSNHFDNPASPVMPGVRSQAGADADELRRQIWVDTGGRARFRCLGKRKIL
ncbi:MAG: transposase [Chromatiaceae bacterium]